MPDSFGILQFSYQLTILHDKDNDYVANSNNESVVF